MEDKFYNYLTAGVLIALFGMLIITATVSIGSDYSKNISEIVGGSLSLNKFNATITNISIVAEQKIDLFKEGNIFSIGADLVLGGFFEIVTALITVVISPFVLVTNIMADVFAIPLIVTTLITALFIFGLMFAIWRLIKIGD